jgi:hypothetical protein
LRRDEEDFIYRTTAEKYKAIVDTIKECNAKGQPVLVGTTSVEKSEAIATLLKNQTNIKFEVLNAKHHEREAMIVAEAGRQPWTIEGMLPVNAAVSSVSVGAVQTTFFIFVAIFTLFLAIETRIIFKAIKQGPKTEE